MVSARHSSGPSTVRCNHRSIRALATALAPFLLAPALLAQPPTPGAPSAPPGDSSRFLILLRSAQVGTEESTVRQAPDGWTITGSGRLGQPVDVTARRLEVKYDANWAPLELTIDALSGTRSTPVRTVVTGTSAASEYRQDGKLAEKVDTIHRRALLLPSPFFAPYEALSMRLRVASRGDTISMYAAPAASLTATVDDISTERIQTVERIDRSAAGQPQLQRPRCASLDGYRLGRRAWTAASSQRADSGARSRPRRYQRGVEPTGDGDAPR